jgi:RecB family exonuclease
MLSATQHVVNIESVFHDSVHRVARAVTYLDADQELINKVLKEFQAVTRKKHTTAVDQDAVIQKYPTVVEFIRRADEARDRSSQLVDQVRIELSTEEVVKWN